MVNAKEFFSGNFLKAEDCKGGEVCKILDEGEITELTNPEGKVKTVMNFQIKIGDQEKTFTPNKTNGNVLVEAFGEETGNWIGKEFKIALAKVSVFGKVKNSIVVEPLGVVPTEKVK
ncbi:hypothetical protein ES705_46514 [subsurface metagenome]